MSNLRDKATTSCGCAIAKGKRPKVDLTGKTIAHLQVIRFTETSTWECRCACGNTRFISTTDLNSGKVKSCGCAKANARRLPKGTAGFNTLLRVYKSGAARRNLPFELTAEQFKSLTSANCFYCKAPPATKITGGGTDRGQAHAQYTYTGIDRVNGAAGYTMTNCIPACRTCNFMRGTLELDTFLNRIQEIAANLKPFMEGIVCPK